MNNTNEKKVEINNWEVALTACYFFISFYGLRAATESYLMEDELPITYMMLLGLVGGNVSILMTFMMKGKTSRTKLIAVGILLMTIVIINLLV